MKSTLWVLKIWLFVKALPYVIPGLIMALVALNFLWDFFSTLVLHALSAHP